ncbi:MAG: polyprenol monophosphomannose synthase [Planctomycetia bacterium]|nr:polyprenol monophosphomannose synthase [Planctomycetia bacterium]
MSNFTSIESNCFPRILVALATYNEIENLPRLIEQIHTTLPEVEILVVDDNSPDGTGDWVLQTVQTEPYFHGIVRKDERGLGSAVLRAFQFAVDNNYDYLINLDADFSHPVDVAPKMIEEILKSQGNLDIIIGSRYTQGGRIVNWSLTRRIMSYGVNCYARIMLGLKTRDNSGSYRIYRVETLRALLQERLLSNGYSFFEETLFRLKRHGARMAEIPITFTDRQFGSSKINQKEAFRALIVIGRLGLSRLIRRR